MILVMCCNVVLPLLTYIQIKAGKNETQDLIEACNLIHDVMKP